MDNKTQPKQGQNKISRSEKDRLVKDKSKAINSKKPIYKH